MSKILKAEAKKGKDGLWRVFLDGEEIALMTPMPWQHFGSFLAHELARGINGRSEIDWKHRFVDYVLNKSDVE